MGNYAGAADTEQLEGLSLWEANKQEGEWYAGEGFPAMQHEVPALAGSASYLREILASGESLRAAFEPVLRAARCPTTDLVDRVAFARAVDRIVGYFNPAEPIGLRGLSFGPPYSVDEALGHFRVVLSQLAARLEELERPGQQLRRPPLPAELCSVIPFAGAEAAPLPLFSEDRLPVTPRCNTSPLRSWQPVTSQPARSQPALGASDASRPQASRLASWSPNRARVAPSATGGVVEKTATGSFPWASIRSLSPQQAHPPAAQVPATTGSGESLEAQLEASRARVAGLRRALGREEDLLRHQAEETRRLEHLQRDLEVEAEAAARRRATAAAARLEARGKVASAPDLSRPHDPGSNAEPVWQSCAAGDADKEAWPLGHLSRAERQTPRGIAEEEKAAEAALDGPMSLEDVQYHLRTVLRLKRRVLELEGALDGREEQVAVLSDELNRRAASLAVRAAAA